jgi:argininosuccinate lyase
MEAAAADEMVAATDIADLLVRRGLPFREAHAVVGALVRHALENEIELSAIEPGRLADFSELLDDEYYEVLAESSWLESKLSHGGTSSSSVATQLDAAAAAIDALGR